MIGLLRQATSEAHVAIERAVPLLDPRLDRPAYARYLARLRAFFAPLERALARHADALADAGFDGAFGTRTRALDADVRAVGAGGALAGAAPDAPEGELPDLPTAAHAVGCLYVLEGSRLGGRVLAAHLTRHLGLDPAAEATFLAPDPEGTTARWATFRERLEAYGRAHGDDGPSVVDGALRTFASLHGWIVTGAPYLA